VLVPASNAVFAISFAEVAETSESTRLFGWAKTLLQRARERSPDDDSYLLYLSGYCEYMDPDGKTEDALEWFSRACVCESPDAWAGLYRAHCLHDLKRWAEAVSAYEAVDLSAFKGPAAWRGEKLREQLGACRLRTGDIIGALADYERVLNIYEIELWTSQI